MKEYIQQTILPRYNFGVLHSLYRLPSGYANENYKLITEKGKVLCRVVKQKTKQQLEQELKLLDFLKSKDFPTASPVARNDGSYINEDDNTLVVLYEFIEGGVPELNKQTSHVMGDITGVLNGLDCEDLFQRTNTINLEKCLRLISLFTNDDRSLASVFSYFEEETRQLAEPIQTKLPEGLVHGDLFADNTVFHSNKLLAIIDFEEACIDQLLFDVGIVTNGFCFPENRFNDTLFKTLLRAYHNQRPLEPLEQELLPWFIRWGAHSQIYWHLRFGLLDQPNKKQMERVRDLIKRVEWLRDHMKELTQLTTQTLIRAN